MGDVLVRLYGSYQYYYADPVKCRSEFEITLKENGGCYSEMFVEALEQDLPQSKSGQSKGKGSNSKGTSNGRASASKVKNSNQNRENCEIESSNHARISPRKQINMNTPQRKMKDDNFLSKVVEEAISKVSNQDGLEKELKFDSPNTEGNSKRETPKQDGMRNKLKRNFTSTSGQAKNKTHDQGEKKRLKQKSSSAAEDTNYQSPKKDEEQEKQELSPSSVSVNNTCSFPATKQFFYHIFFFHYKIELLLLGWWNIFWKITRIAENKSHANSWSSCTFWVTIQLNGGIILISNKLVAALKIIDVFCMSFNVLKL
ncbi:hypothetical protein NC652_014021 [Populus alba x Populus x berolinensis]|nr:hypothetical protein NC652_014021 [Populus alba x Populus x berolinensis]